MTVIAPSIGDANGRQVNTALLSKLGLEVTGSMLSERVFDQVICVSVHNSKGQNSCGGRATKKPQPLIKTLH